MAIAEGEFMKKKTVIDQLREEKVTFGGMTFDAKDWAKVFVKMVKQNPSIATDEDTMLGWFANALMRGFDEAKFRINKVENLNQTDLVSGGESVNRLRIWLSLDFPKFDFKITPIIYDPQNFIPKRGILIRHKGKLDEPWSKVVEWNIEEIMDLTVSISDVEQKEIEKYKIIVDKIKSELDKLQ